MPWLVKSYFRFFFPKFARKAKHILTVSNYSKKDISHTYSISEQNISVVYNAPNNLYKPISEIDFQINLLLELIKESLKFGTQ
jgi:hypothetical protein